MIWRRLLTFGGGQLVEAAASARVLCGDEPTERKGLAEGAAGARRVRAPSENC